METEREVGAVVLIPVEINRWVDDSFPGWVECNWRDAHGGNWVVIEKVPVVTAEALTPDSVFPRRGVIAGELVRAWTDELGRRRCLVDTRRPWGIETKDGKTQFEIHEEQIAMNVVETRWQERTSHYETGVYFGVDETIPLHGTPETGYRAGIRQPIRSLLEAKPNGWTDLDTNCTAQAGDLQIYGGSTSWEGAGFVAVEQRSSGCLLWLLHLEDSEAFTKVACDGEIVLAVSESYPLRYEWRIPLASPEQLVVSRSRE